LSSRIRFVTHPRSLPRLWHVRLQHHALHFGQRATYTALTTAACWSHSKRVLCNAKAPSTETLSSLRRATAMLDQNLRQVLPAQPLPLVPPTGTPATSTARRNVEVTAVICHELCCAKAQSTARWWSLRIAIVRSLSRHRAHIALRRASACHTNGG
jgi:hypothetical protein